MLLLLAGRLLGLLLLLAGGVFGLLLLFTGGLLVGFLLLALFFLLLLFLLLLFLLLLFLLLLFFLLLLRHLFRQGLFQHPLGEGQVVQRVLVACAQRQRRLVGFHGTLVITAFVAGVAQVIQRVCPDLLAFDLLEHRAGLRIAPCAIQRHTAPVVIGKPCGRLAVLPFGELLRGLLLRVPEPVCVDSCRTRQAGQQDRAAPEQAGHAGRTGCAAHAHALPARYPGSVRRNSGNSSSSAIPASQ